MRVLSAEQCRTLDRLAEAEGTPSEVLMQRAGWFVAREALGYRPNRITILCGKGANGGDGLVAARMLAQRGVPVRVWMAVSEPSELTPGCARELSRFSGEVHWQQNLTVLCQGSDLLIDALLGTGAAGAPQGSYSEAIRVANDSDKPILAVDIPSGIDADTGAALGDFVHADRTVTFGGPKLGFFQREGVAAVGRWLRGDIGFSPASVESLSGPEVFLGKPRDLPARKADAHKRSNGRLLIVSGSPQYPGAPHLAVRAAVRAGLGLVALAAVPGLEAGLPEAIRIPLRGDAAADAEILLAVASDFDAAVMGPGLGPGARDLLSRLFPSWTLPTCLDADALNAIAGGVEPPKCPVLATPHTGELARLLGVASAEVHEDRFAAVRRGAQRVGGACLLKGPNTLITGHSGPIWINGSGNAGMASAGMGDALAGLAGALLAWGFSLVEAGTAAAWHHGAAGDRLSESGRAFTATEVADELANLRSDRRSS